MGLHALITYIQELLLYIIMASGMINGREVRQAREEAEEKAREGQARRRLVCQACRVSKRFCDKLHPCSR